LATKWCSSASAGARVGSVASVTGTPGQRAGTRTGTARRARRPSLVLEELAVLVDVRPPLLRHPVVGEDRLHGTRRLACLTVDALVAVDVELAVALVDAVDGA